MKKAVALIFDPIVDEKNFSEFEELIRSNYISKRAKDFVFILSVDENVKSKEIHEFILSKCSFRPSLLICRMENFYGNFSDKEFVEWFKVHFSHMDLIE
ncbi:hypothetical protein RT99_14780 [Flavobacterium sp. MEB061]|uniref:hypothetical protein n=1 Tax=Flavobacterium sp. MEB061 TaxID=1587524 RepID=UPI0005AC84E5|nr:hypothetical protein [Flavobacterium sp. MEB061]KIQ19975.1 hypothetical protein RT99_14780 [Flavobacterium sp. MEB061]